MSVGSPMHQLFLQSMISEGVLSLEESKQLYQKVARVCGERRDMEFSIFIATLNRQLKPLDLELAQARMEDTPAIWCGFVNRSSDAAAKISSKFSPAELELFNKVVEHLLADNDGLATSTSLLNATTELERKLSASAAQDFLKMLVKQKWLEQVRQGIYGPGPRFILELRPFLYEIFKEEIKDCHLCKDPVIRGQSCDNDGCNARLHLLCVAKLARGRESLKCPKCHREWPHEVPEIEWPEEEPIDNQDTPTSRSSVSSSLELSGCLSSGAPPSKRKKGSRGQGKH